MAVHRAVFIVMWQTLLCPSEASRLRETERKLAEKERELTEAHREVAALKSNLESKPKHQDQDHPAGWAWKDPESHHRPHLQAKDENSDVSDHAWAAKGKQPRAKPSVQEAIPKEADVDLTMPASAQMPKKVLQTEFDNGSGAQNLGDSDITKISKSGLSLEDALEEDLTPNMKLCDFMPKCLKHTHALIADLDYNYGDAQLETVLRNWCSSAQEFPKTRGTQKVIGFKEHGTCTNFASDLANARFTELKTKSDKGYRNFCTAFFEHHGGFQMAPPKKTEEPPAQSGAPWSGLSLLAVALALLFQ